MGNPAKVLILPDQVYVSPYLMRPLRRLDEVERAGAGAASKAKARHKVEPAEERRIVSVVHSGK